MCRVHLYGARSLTISTLAIPTLAIPTLTIPTLTIPTPAIPPHLLSSTLAIPNTCYQASLAIPNTCYRERAPILTSLLGWIDLVHPNGAALSHRTTFWSTSQPINKFETI